MFLAIVLSTLFATLFGCWYLPHTLALRYFLMYSGSLGGLFIIWKSHSLVKAHSSLPILLIILLVVWVTCHLIWIGHDHVLQLAEFFTIWKKIIISIPFAAGLGIAVSLNFNNSKLNGNLWKIIYAGLFLPTIIYFIKLFFTFWAQSENMKIYQYLILDNDHLGSSWGISRANYVFFCLPSFAITLGNIINSFNLGRIRISLTCIYLLSLSFPLTIFYLENDRTGILFSVVLMLIATCKIICQLFKRFDLKKLATIFILLLMASVLAGASFQQNPAWKSLSSDTKIALQIDKYDSWRSREVYPTNDLGKTVSGSNYERIAWAIAGLRMVAEHPWGYGLMTTSFKYWGLQRWPDIKTSLSHSAWLDFTLGYGIPGFLLLFFAAVTAWLQSSRLPNPWSQIGRWGLGVLILIFFVKELSMEIFINAFIFLIIFVSAMSAGNQSNLLPSRSN